MPFPVEERYIMETEANLNVKFPIKFKLKMKEDNGGEIEKDDFYYELFPFFDKLDKKRISRTCNHIELETQNAQEWENFPRNAIAIGEDGGGNYAVLIHNGNGELGEEVYDWFHETGELEEVAKSIEEFNYL